MSGLRPDKKTLQHKKLEQPGIVGFAKGRSADGPRFVSVVFSFPPAEA
jgi:hypothetical protein